MSNNEFENYKKAYAEFVSEIVGLHNAHLNFVVHLGRETGFALRKHVKKIIKIQKELHRSSVAAFKEHRANNKVRRELSKQKREMVLQKIKEGKITYKAKKNGNNNSTTDSI